MSVDHTPYKVDASDVKIASDMASGITKGGDTEQLTGAILIAQAIERHTTAMHIVAEAISYVARRT